MTTYAEFETDIHPDYAAGERSPPKAIRAVPSRDPKILAGFFPNGAFGNFHFFDADSETGPRSNPSPEYIVAQRVVTLDEFSAEHKACTPVMQAIVDELRAQFNPAADDFEREYKENNIRYAARVVAHAKQNGATHIAIALVNEWPSNAIVQSGCVYVDKALNVLSTQPATKPPTTPKI